MVASLLFYFFAGLLIASAVMVITAENPIHSVLFLILVFCNSTCLMLLMEAEFLAMVFLIVYVGAIAVLFLFVVMMLNIKWSRAFDKSSLPALSFGFLAGIFLINIFMVVGSDAGQLLQTNFFEWKELLTVGLTNTHLIGKILYTNFFYFFLLASLVLLVAMIGAIVLTLQKHVSVKSQNIGVQIARSTKIPFYNQR